MTADLTHRWNQILSRITSQEFLANRGIGNEIACYVFDYDASEELHMREYLGLMLERLHNYHSQLQVLHLNLLDLVVAYLNQRSLLDKAIALEQSKGDGGLLKALKGPLTAEKIRDFIGAEYQPEEYDLLLISGVGSVWPLLRAHSLLNCLHPILGHTPLVMFYPGRFDGKTLRLFGGIASESAKPGTEPYYRAFSLVPRETSKC
ncbi:DUF1788 domain-containing protein [Synechocystis sp. PCC 6714]|uniref:DUF1788 domain-containing protein n=1 Tax=Synechocystis sp. (strain PCC 6714) TaxID=1147 RepID=UPI00040A13DA|nr:DUF1788 domain-containing protein [Synechocystis sp. PCC 6714]AIE76139.1 putative cytoplasmic protein [Synechocystis sp. PCC 6714]